MEFPVVKPSKRARILSAADAVMTVDVVEGVYRATRSRTEKMEWLSLVWRDEQVRRWCGMVDEVPLKFSNGPGKCRYSVYGNQLTYCLGSQLVSDTDLALVFAFSARSVGLPVGARVASGVVHDPQMTMLSVMGLWVHSPVRAKYLYEMYRQMRVPVAVPVGGWDPGSWV